MLIRFLISIFFILFLAACATQPVKTVKTEGGGSSSDSESGVSSSAGELTSVDYTSDIPSDYVGIHLYYFDSGEMKETTEIDGGYTGQGFKFKGFVTRLTYTKQLTDRLKLGGNFKYINEQTTSADLSMSSVAFDIGSNFDTGIFGNILNHTFPVLFICLVKATLAASICFEITLSG